MKAARFHSFALAAALTTGLFAAHRASAAPVIVNGGFEDPAEAQNTITEVTLTGIPGWTGSSIGGNAHEYLINGNVQDLSGNNYGTTPFGAQYLGLNAIKNNSFRSIESQSLDGFVAGQTYELSVFYANLDGATDAKISVVASDGSTGSGTVLSSQLYTAPKEGPYGAGNITFHQALLDFTALTTGSVTFSIGNQSKTGTMGIDNVSLAAAVPEPTTAAMALLGAAALAGVMARRRARQS